MKRIALFTLYILCVLSFLSAGKWDGLYRWDNPTKKTNKGKVEYLVMRVATDEKGKMVVYSVEGDKEYRIFPFVDVDEPGYDEWHKYKEDSSVGECYRINNAKLNTSSMSPTKWKMGNVVAEDDYLEAAIVSKAFNIEVEVLATYRFNLLADGTKTLTFASSTDSKMAAGLLFENPDPASDGSFTLTIVSEEGKV